MGIPKRISDMQKWQKSKEFLKQQDCHGGTWQNTDEKADYLDFISVVSALAVVFLHTNGCFWSFSATARYWWTANVIECLFYFAVPIFFMISGATLLDFFQRYGVRDYFARRIRKTVVPYIVWSIIGLAFQVCYLKNIGKESVNGKYIVRGLLSGGLVEIYWFFIPLFCLYLSIPLFAAVQDRLRRKVFLYLAVACFVLNCLIPFMNAVFSINVGYQFSVTVGSGYLLYLILGYLLHKYEIGRWPRYVLYGTGLVGLMLHIVGTYKLSVAAGSIVSVYKGYNNVPCVMYSVAVFLLLKQIWGGKLGQVLSAKRLIRFLRNYTFSLYLIHWYVMKIMVKELDINTQSIYYRLGAPFVILAITVLVTAVMRKIPFVKNILP